MEPLFGIPIVHTQKKGETMQPDMSEMLYNEYVMGDRDYYKDIDNEIGVYDDSGEWYNQYTDENDGE